MQVVNTHLKNSPVDLHYAEPHSLKLKKLGICGLRLTVKTRNTATIKFWPKFKLRNKCVKAKQQDYF